MKRVSLRWVILLPLLAAISAGFLAFAIYIDHSDRSTRLATIDQELVRAERVDLNPPATGQAEGVNSPTGPAFTEAEAPVQLTVSSDGDVIAAQRSQNPFSGDALAMLGSTREPTTSDVEGYRVLASPRPEGQVKITALSLEGFRATTAALRRDLLIGGLIIALVESAMAWWLASRLVRPLTTMTSTVNQIADGALDTHMHQAGGSREVCDLSTDIERMVDRLRAALAKREQSEAAATQARDDMKRFLADVSHEIRTPLTSLKGYSDLYERGMLAEPGALDRAMSRVGNESVRLHHLVNSMLELVRGETGAQVVTDVEVPHVVRAVADDLRAAYPQRRIDTQVGPDTGGAVAGDPDRLHQAILNLGANACTHTPTSTPITIAVSTSSDAVEISVIDHGTGIDEDEQQQIFLPFYRTDPSRTRTADSGAGLGLAVTQHITREHHGSIGINTTPGGGATFTLHLPASRRTTDT